MKTEKKDYKVVKSIVHKNLLFKAGERISLTQQEAQFLILGGKVSIDKPQTKKGH